MKGLARAVCVWKWCMILLGVAAAVMAARGQVLHGSEPLPSFEVVSVRPSEQANIFNGLFRPVNDGVEVRVASVKDMVRYAYGVAKEDELSGLPKWASEERFNVDGRVDAATASAWGQLSWQDKDEQARLRMQAMLQKRFALKMRFVTKDLPVWTVTVAKGGFKCKPATMTVPAALAAKPRFGVDPPPPPPPPPGYVAPSPQELRALQQTPHWTPKGWPFWLLVNFLGAQPELDGRVVVDRTGLSGAYDCDVVWAHADAEVPGPSFFTAVRDQMGLKLTQTKAPVETIEVLSVERPTEN